MSLIITLRCSNLTQLFLFDSFFFVFCLSFIFLDGSSSPIICPGDNFHLMNILPSASSFSLSSHFSLPAIAIFFLFFFSFFLSSLLFHSLSCSILSFFSFLSILFISLTLFDRLLVVFCFLLPINRYAPSTGCDGKPAPLLSFVSFKNPLEDAECRQ